MDKCIMPVNFFYKLLHMFPNDLNNIIYEYYNPIKCNNCGKPYDKIKKCETCNRYLCDTCHFNFYKNLY